MVEITLKGRHSTVFAYGVTGSGKTHTMLGPPKQPKFGIIPKSIDYLFECIKNHESSDNTVHFLVVMSYYQIYNEQIRDLLQTETLQLEIQELPKGTIITNLARVQVNSYDEVMEMIDLGNTNRVVSQTELNRHSSRSHAIIELTIIKEV